MKNGAVVLVSGGLDSTVLLASLLCEGEYLLGEKEAIALSVRYGQRHVKEIEAAEKVCALLKVELKTLDISGLGALLPGSSQTDASVPVPHGHYEDESMQATVVPNRNAILLSIAAAVAIAHGKDQVLYAAHAGDHAIYPDCRASFVEAMGKVLEVCHYHPITLNRPFLGWHKKDIVLTGSKLRAPMELTWSCYEGGEVHCGKCGTCVERREAFTLAGVDDPTVYRE